MHEMPFSPSHSSSVVLVTAFATIAPAFCLPLPSQHLRLFLVLWGLPHSLQSCLLRRNVKPHFKYYWVVNQCSIILHHLPCAFIIMSTFYFVIFTSAIEQHSYTPCTPFVYWLLVVQIYYAFFPVFPPTSRANFTIFRSKLREPFCDHSQSTSVK